MKKSQLVATLLFSLSAGVMAANQITCPTGSDIEAVKIPYSNKTIISSKSGNYNFAFMTPQAFKSGKNVGDFLGGEISQVSNTTVGITCRYAIDGQDTQLFSDKSFSNCQQVGQCIEGKSDSCKFNCVI